MRLQLAPREVHLWTAAPRAVVDSDLLARYDALMTPEERARQRRYIFEKHRLEALVTRALVRTTLSRYRDVEPTAWRFSANEWGRPLPDPDCGLRFNLSNHPTMVVCAVVEALDVGVDVEPVARGNEMFGIRETVFSPVENREVHALPSEAARLDRCVSLWTLKEAYIKARGMGLALPTNRFTFDFSSPAQPSVSFAPPIDDDPQRWSFRSFDVDGHRISLALPAPIAAVRAFRVVPLHGAQPIALQPVGE